MQQAALKVLFLTAEATPFFKVGGLAEFSGALPKALRALGVDVRLILPRYGHIKSGDGAFQRAGASIPVPVGASVEPAHLLASTAAEVPTYLVWNDQYFTNRQKVYGFNDDPQRFAFFCRAVIEVLRILDWRPDVIHVNDWHTAAVPTWLDVYGRDLPEYRDIGSLFTIHDVAYQGECGRLILSFAQMQRVPHLPVEQPGKLNWLAQGIAHSDLVNTVSPAYAQELLSGEAEGGVAELIRARRDRFCGILSGIDTELWNPATDTALTQTYDQDTVRMRAVNKAAVQRELQLPVAQEVPLLGLITRLDRVKGIDLLLEALDVLLSRSEVQFVLLGTGAPDYEAGFRALQARYPSQARALIRFDERMAHRLYGSLDAFVLSSQSEPASLGLMTAMRYGAVPVVRAVGGAGELVLDADTDPQLGTGFTFAEYTPSALLQALERALRTFKHGERWMAVQRRAMQRDVSWGVSARAYLELYEKARALRRREVAET